MKLEMCDISQIDNEPINRIRKTKHEENTPDSYIDEQFASLAVRGHELDMTTESNVLRLLDQDKPVTITVSPKVKEL